jgi:glycosyltransferase involved in cell wall biosynthesis
MPRIVMTSFGFHDAGGGTIVPRHVAVELRRRGWEVTVFHAGVAPVGGAGPYALVESEFEGVRLVGVHNRAHGLFDPTRPDREIDDPPITAAYAALLDRIAPDVVHFHNLHNLGAALMDETALRGIPSYLSTHNYWLACPRAYLFDERLDLCHGPGDGGRCAACAGSHDREASQRRLAELRARFGRSVNVCLAVSHAVRRTLEAAGYPGEAIDVVPQGMPQADRIHRLLGGLRSPGRVGEQLTVGFFGSAYPQKGPLLLAAAAQLTSRDLRVRIHGEIPPAVARQVRSADRRGSIEISGAFSHDQLPQLLAAVDAAVIPSIWWDCAPLMVAECLAGGVPVVGAAMGGIPEGVRDGINGLVVDGRDPAALAAALDRLAGEDGLLARLQAGIEPPHPFAAYVDELEAYYAGERPGRARAGHGPAPVVRWKGDHEGAQSLATVNRAVCDAFDRSGAVAVERVARGGGRAGRVAPHAAQVEVRHSYPPDLTPSQSRLALIQPWEFGSIPAAWVEPLTRHADRIWVPSEYVRRMYLDAGIAPERVEVIPNGVDTRLFRPQGERMALPGGPGTRFLFVGGLVPRKGPDLLVSAYQEAFAGRDDVTLVIKDFGADSIYPFIDRSRLIEHAATGALPRIVHLDRELSTGEMAALYRGCDVLVHPYRGEGFAMPVLEAMACGLPVIVTAGGPTDEFCPDGACWRIAAAVEELPVNRIDDVATAGRPHRLQPDPGELLRLLVEADRDPAGRARRGACGARAARAYGWDAVAERYRDRIASLASHRPLHSLPAAPAPEVPEGSPLVLATPAWRGADRLGELLRAWRAAPDGAGLVLAADPQLGLDAGDCAQRVAAAAAEAGVDLEACADVTVLSHAQRADQHGLFEAAFDAYVPLHGGCAGHARLAAAGGAGVVSCGDLADWLAERARRAA